MEYNWGFRRKKPNYTAEPSQKFMPSGYDRIWVGLRSQDSGKYALYTYIELGGTHVPLRYKGEVVEFDTPDEAIVFLRDKTRFGLELR